MEVQQRIKEQDDRLDTKIFRERRGAVADIELSVGVVIALFRLDIHKFLQYTHTGTTCVRQIRSKLFVTRRADKIRVDMYANLSACYMHASVQISITSINEDHGHNSCH